MFDSRRDESDSDQARVFREAIKGGDLNAVRQMIHTNPDLLFIRDETGGLMRAVTDSPNSDVADYLARSMLQRLREGTIPDAHVYSAIHFLGEAAHSETGYRGCEILRAEAEPVVAGFLVHPKPNMRYIAIMVLALHWDLSRYARAFQRISQSDVDDSVRAIALRSVGLLLRGTRDYDAARLLLSIFRDSAQEAGARETAYEGLVDVWHGSDAYYALFLRKRRAEEPLREEAEKAKTEGEKIEVERRLDRLWEDFVDWDFVAQVEREVKQQSIS